MNALEPVRREGASQVARYAGLVTRGTGFAIDVAILAGLAALVLGAIQLCLSLFGYSLSDLPDWLTGVLGVGGWICLNLIYFVGAWTLTGQTMGMRAMSIEVQRLDGGRLSVWRGLLRAAGLVLAAIPFMAGYLVILISDRRRGLQDWLGGSVVVFMLDRSQAWGGLLRGAGARERPPRPAQLPSPRTGDVRDATRV